MWVCEQCKCSHSLENRIIYEMCGHKKCRQCFLKDNDKCSQCQTTNIKGSNGKTEAIPPINVDHSVIYSSSTDAKNSLEQYQQSCKGNQENDASTNTNVLKERSQITYSTNIAIEAKEQQKDLTKNDDQCQEEKRNLESRTKTTNEITKKSEKHFSENDKQYLQSNKKDNTSILELLVKGATPTISETTNFKKLKRIHLRSIIAKVNHIPNIVDKDGIRKYHCLGCDRKFTSRSQRYYHLHCGQKDSSAYKCNLCEKVFSNPGQMKYHMAIHTSASIKCDVCHKVYANSIVLRKHEKLHKRELYSCEHCSKQTRTKEALESHIKIVHHKIKPFQCDECGKSYGTRSSFHQHLAKHGISKSFICEICGLSFRSNNSLKLHLRTHSHDETFYCEICKKKFINLTSYRRHLAAHKDIYMYNCNICEVATVRRDNMLRHLKNFHSNANFYMNVTITQAEVAIKKTIDNREKEMVNEKEILKDPVILNTLSPKPIENLPVNQEQCEPLLKTVANSSVIKCIGNVEPVRIPELLPRECIVDKNQTVDELPMLEESQYPERVNNEKVFENDYLPNIELYRRILEEVETDSITEDESFHQQKMLLDISSNCRNIIGLSESICEIPAIDDSYKPGEELIAEIIIPTTLNNEISENEKSRNQAFKHPTMHWRKSYKYYYESEYNKFKSSS